MWGGVLGMTVRGAGSSGAGLPITLDPVDLRASPSRSRSRCWWHSGDGRAGLPAVRLLCIVYVELIRGVPLISGAIHGQRDVPAVHAGGASTLINCCAPRSRVILFAAAYLAEVIRGGLQSHYRRASTRRLTRSAYRTGSKTGLIILPQALRLVIPPLVNTFIGFFKDTSPGADHRHPRPAVRSGKTALMADPTWAGLLDL